MGNSIFCPSIILEDNISLNCFLRITDVTIFRVVAGEHSLTEVSGLEQNREVTGYFQHEQFVKATFENDIALLYVRII